MPEKDNGRKFVVFEGGVVWWPWIIFILGSYLLLGTRESCLHDQDRPGLLELGDRVVRVLEKDVEAGR